MNSSNVPFGDGPEQKQRWSSFWTTGLCSIKSSSRRDTFLSCVPWCRKAFTLSKKTNAFFFYTQRLKVRRSPQVTTCIIIRASLLMSWLRSGTAISNLLLMLRPCFTWLLSSQPTRLPPSNRARDGEWWPPTSSCSHGWWDYELPRRPVVGHHSTCRAAGDSRGASVSRWIPPLNCFSFLCPCI